MVRDLKRVTTKCGVLSALVAVMIMGGCSRKSDASRKLYRMGDRAQVESLVYTIYETEWKPQLGEGTSAKIPTNRFLILRLTITNSGNQMATIPEMTLLDSAGKPYPEVSEAPGLPNWLGVIRTVNPAQTEEGRVVFDVPSGAYKLKVSSDSDPASESAAALVQIPFEFQSVPQPNTSANR